MFDSTLLTYMNQAQCSAKQLADAVDIAQYSISRYLNGVRVPDPDSDTVEKLAEGLADGIKAAQGANPADYDEILQELRAAAKADKERFPHETFSRNLKMLLGELGFSQSEAAKRLFISPPTLSRILAGNYSTRDPEGIIASVIDAIGEYCQDEDANDKVWGLLERETGAQRGNSKTRSKLLADWLSGRLRQQGDEATYDMIDLFRDYDPSKYIKAFNLGNLRIPQTRWKIPTTKEYSGPEGMEKGFIDFFKATITSTSNEDVILYANAPIGHLADDPNQYKDLIRVGWTLVLQGRKVHIIHNTNRPTDEIRMGIQMWLPVYMTGQVESYYVDNSEDMLIYDALLVSGGAALTGRAFKGAEESGTYTFTKSRKLIAQARAQAELMLEQSKRLVRVYDQEGAGEFEEMLQSHLDEEGSIRNSSVSLPIETMDEELLTSILERHCVAAEDQEAILKEHAKRKAVLNRLLAHCRYEEIIAESLFADEDGEEVPLAMPEWVCKQPLYYTEEEWAAHLQQTERFASENANYIIRRVESPAFGNVHMHVRENSYAIIDRNHGTELHFELLHPWLVKNFYDFEIPVL